MDDLSQHEAILLEHRQPQHVGVAPIKTPNAMDNTYKHPGGVSLLIDDKEHYERKLHCASARKATAPVPVSLSPLQEKKYHVR
jgi:hypothetical protein